MLLKTIQGTKGANDSTGCSEITERAKQGLLRARLRPHSCMTAWWRPECDLRQVEDEISAHSPVATVSFCHRDSDEVVTRLSAQFVLFLRKDSGGGDLVNTELTGHWCTKGRDIFGFHRQLSLW